MKQTYKRVMKSIDSIIDSKKTKGKSSSKGLLSPQTSPSKNGDDIMNQVARYIKAIRDNKKEVK